jgi:uncharacterized membrane protein YkvA (DUF1232 family)
VADDTRDRSHSPASAADDGEPEPLDTAHRAPSLRPHGDELAGELEGSEPGDEQSAPRATLPAGRRRVADRGPVRLLAFYDRLRHAVADTLERRGGRLGRPVSDALLLVPDLFMLLARLALDREVPAQTRTLIGGALAYFIVPIDLLPEAFVGAAGFVDDLVLGAAVLSQVMSPEMEERARRYWSGREDVLRVLRDVAGTAQSLLGENLFGRLRALLAKRGVVLEGAAAGGGRARLDASEGEDEEELGASGDVGRSPYH